MDELLAVDGLDTMTGPGDKMTREAPIATSEKVAEEGCVLASGFFLSEAVSWREGDVYVLRGTEFDVLAEDEDFATAVDTFVDRLFDYAGMLSELVAEDAATDDEREAFATLSARFFPLFQAMESAERKRRPPSRKRGSGTGHWRHRGTPASGSPRLSVA
jgi:hypothetical protein